MSYCGYVVKIKTRPHPNAERLQLGTCMGNQVVIGLDVQDESIGLFFPCDGALSREMLEHNDLLPRYDENGNRIGGGYFSENGRVKSQKFRGERSDGFWLPISSLDWALGERQLAYSNIGDQITEINGHLICHKYVTESTAKAQKEQKQNPPKRINPFFRKHVDTEQFRFNAHTIKAGAIVYITEKLHGTSFRIGRVLDEVRKPYNLIEKLQKFLGLNIRSETSLEYAYLNGTRNTVLSGGKEGYYGNEQFRHNLLCKLQGLLHKGETVYGELVGWVNNDRPIMQFATFDDKTITKIYGKEMRYLYGNKPGESTAYVYRITQTNEDGVVFELSDQQMRRRAEEIGLNAVPLLLDPFIYNGDEEYLRELVEFRTDGPSTIDSSHIREGCVIRAEQNGKIVLLKNKGFWFGVGEGYIKDKGEIDIEESA